MRIDSIHVDKNDGYIAAVCLFHIGSLDASRTRGRAQDPVEVTPGFTGVASGVPEYQDV